MQKEEVYSWRIASETKAALERRARVAGKSVAQLLDEIAQAWLDDPRNAEIDDDAEQARIRRKVRGAIGTLHGGRGVARSENVRALVRRSLTSGRKTTR